MLRIIIFSFYLLLNSFSFLLFLIFIDIANSSTNFNTLGCTRQFNSTATPLDFGSGHVDPNKAIDPGLIYDIDFQGYVEFICSLGYTEKQIRALIRKSHWSCSNQSQLNYPSFIAVLTNSSGSHIVKKYTRTVTNVGDGGSVYRSTIEHVPAGTKMTVKPKTLSFSRKFQKRSYMLRLEIERKRLTSDKSYAFLKWGDQHNHVVSSPILVAKWPPE